MGVIAVLIQTVWFSVEEADVKAIVCTGITIIESPPKATAQLFPVVVMPYANGDPVSVDGEPEMVNVLPVTEAETPAGKPVTVAPVAPPPSAYVTVAIGVLIQTV